MVTSKSGKKIGKQAEGTPAELEFIYSRLDRMSVPDILWEIQDTTFPPRSKGFIKRCQTEFNVAKKVLETQLKKEIDPVIVKHKLEHFKSLGESLYCFVEEDSLDNVRIKHCADGTCDYTLNNGNGAVLSSKQYIAAVIGKAELAIEGISAFDMKCLLTHLIAEYPDMKDLEEWVANNPYEFMQRVITLLQRGTFIGTCPVCEKW